MRISILQAHGYATTRLYRLYYAYIFHGLINQNSKKGMLKHTYKVNGSIWVKFT